MAARLRDVPTNHRLVTHRPSMVGTALDATA
jgi:hypothetical protein